VESPPHFYCGRRHNWRTDSDELREDEAMEEDEVQDPDNEGIQKRRGDRRAD